MTKAEKTKLLTTNAALWSAGILAAFILPLVTDSITDGRSAFLRMLMFLLPMCATLMISNSLLSKAIGPATDE